MFALFTSLLLASAALAAPSAGFEARTPALKNRAAGGTGSGHLAGAYLTMAPGTVTNVTATFIAPAPETESIPTDSGAFFSVGIDGFSCPTVFQAGIGFTITSGRLSYNVWSRWYPDPAFSYPDHAITVGPGDQIQATVVAFTSTTGFLIIENLSTGQTVSQYMISDHALCLANAEWVVQDWDPLSPSTPALTLADFGSITFTNATAGDSSGNIYTPAGAATEEILQGGYNVTSTTIDDDDSVTVTYIAQ